jgi:hypothetical protein
VPRFEEDPSSGGTARGRDWVEIDRRGLEVLQVRGSGDEPGKVRTTRLAREEDAEALYLDRIRRITRRGFECVGPCIHLAPSVEANRPPPSLLWIEEAFAAEDDRFVAELLRVAKPEKLGAWASRWLEDKRPFARQALFGYVDDGCDRPFHKALVKNLFKGAEAAADDELMAHFLVAFDRLSARYRTRAGDMLRDPSFSERLTEGGSSPCFSRATRRYLTRRAWRYFRRLGYRDPARYGRAIRHALSLYEDRHLAKPLRLLDAWGLMNALYGESPVVSFAPRGVVLREGRTLKELAYAPAFPTAHEGAFGELVALVATARSKPARAFFKHLLEQHCEKDLAALSLLELRPLFASPHEEAQLLAARLVPRAPGAERLALSEWMSLLAVPNAEVVALLCEAVARHVAPSRLTLEQCVELATSSRAPVAELGARWVFEKDGRSSNELAGLVGVSRAKVESVRRRALDLLSARLATSNDATATHVRDLCDSPFADARAVGLTLIRTVPRFGQSAELHWALAESPWPEVRAFGVATAKAWLDREPSASAGEARQHLFGSTVLAVHRGSKEKRRAVRTIADRAASNDTNATELLHLVSLVARSVRAAERSAAIAALARAIAKEPSLAARVAELLPEVRFSGEVAR